MSLTLELLRQLAVAYGPAKVFNPEEPRRVVAPGVVLIDGIDVHLHPTWQRSVGLFFTQHFPRIQFIVTSHSPLVCQAAEVGTVFLLPKPGSSGGRMLAGAQLSRLLYGNVLDAYGTGVFGQGVTRSESAERILERLAGLNDLELERDLSPEEVEEQGRLRATFPHLGSRPLGSRVTPCSLILSPLLPADAADALAELQRDIDARLTYRERVAAGKSAFSSKNRRGDATFDKVREALTAMCAGRCRCMYCEDSAADEVEHFWPKDLYPEHVFAWLNYLYACGPCNGPRATSSR